jgi:hypothetical protein
MAAVVYLLCTVTALGCSLLLLRGYRRTTARLLFWSGLCFAFLALENLLLFVDRIIYPNADLSLWRTPPALVAIVLLLYGLVWKNK